MTTTYDSKKTKTNEAIPCFLKDGSKREDPTKIRRSDNICVTKSCNANSILNPEDGQCVSKSTIKGSKLASVRNFDRLFSDKSLQEIQNNRFKQSKDRASRKRSTKKRTAKRTTTRIPPIAPVPVPPIAPVPVPPIAPVPVPPIAPVPVPPIAPVPVPPISPIVPNQNTTVFPGVNINNGERGNDININGTGSVNISNSLSNKPMLFSFGAGKTISNTYDVPDRIRSIKFSS